jgi:diadenosine tetraphosphate (Ap4A) HIT family hydrolase
MNGSSNERIKRFLENCDGCKRSQGIDGVIGGIIELNGDWVLNHLNGQDGFLGWMALQPRFHRMELSQLTSSEARVLGINIQKVDKALRNYWSLRFPDDSIQRVYVVYFFESVFDKIPTKFHLHIHLIPRTEMFGQWLQHEDGSGIIAWNIYKIGNPGFALPGLPERYKKSTDNIVALMTHLRSYLKT